MAVKLQDLRSDNFADVVEQVTIRYPALVNRSQNHFDLGDPVDVPSPYSVALKHIDSAIGQLKSLRREMQALAAHAHNFNGDDYCIYCGLDGRA